MNRSYSVWSPVLATLTMSLGIATMATAQPVFTGHAALDFAGLSDVQIVADPSGQDVGVPMNAPPGTISGWDISNVYMHYDHGTDVLSVGIECFSMICGDADSDGDGSLTSAWLSANQGVDLPDYGGTEYCTLLLDTDNNGSFDSGGSDVVIGISSSTDYSSMQAAIFTGSSFTPGFAFGAPLPNPVMGYASPMASAPDLEFTIANFSSLPGFSFSPGEAFSFGINVSQGSFTDDGIGEDYVPGAGVGFPIVVEEEQTAGTDDVISGFSLAQNYPNPFNPRTTIEFNLAQTEFVNLGIYNLQGQLITTLVNGFLGAGNQSTTFEAGNLSSGVYIYTLQSQGQTQSRKLVLLK